MSKATSMRMTAVDETPQQKDLSKATTATSGGDQETPPGSPRS